MFSQKSKKFLFTAAILLAVAILGVVLKMSLRESAPAQDSPQAETQGQYLYNLDSPDSYDKALTVSVFDEALSIQPLEASASGKVPGNSGVVKYVDAYRNTDVVQTRKTDKLKEDIILKQPGHPGEFKYQIDLERYDFEMTNEGDINFYAKGKGGDDLYGVFSIPAPFMVDANGKKSSTSDVATTFSAEGILKIEPDQNWLGKATYPVTLDPTVEISILNVHSHPQQGQDWAVSFRTVGRADLKIIPDDRATIDDDEFVSLFCGDEIREPEILENDVIYFPNWECLPSEASAKEDDGVGKVVHYTLKAGKHRLRFEYGGQTAFAYNDSDTYDSAGTFEWTAPAGVTSVDVECWGGGGGGGGNEGSYGGGGGGGGAYSEKTGISVSPGSGYTVVVGAGGPGAAFMQNGTGGGDSYFIDVSTLLAKGGAGGVYGTGGGGAGGVAGSGVGDTKFSGGNGAAGYMFGAGGGGGAAGDASNGGNASGNTGGTGGTSGGGNGGNGTVGGSAPGGGGGGDMAGVHGDGADGKCVITYTVTEPATPSVILKTPSSSTIFRRDVIFK